MEMLSVFTDVLHVSNLSSAQHLGAILDQNDAFTKQEVTLFRIIEYILGRTVNTMAATMKPSKN